MIALEVGKWVQETIEKFLKQNIRQSKIVTAPNWEKDGVVHASQLGTCPKKVALKDKGLLVEEPTMFSLLRMQEGTLMGEMVVSALQWALGDYDWKPNEANFVAAISEFRVVSDDLAGNMDILVHVRTKSHESIWVPVEIKLTDAWKYEGVAPSHFLQVAGYVRLLETTERFGKSAVIVTIYDNQEAGVWSKLWAVVHEHGVYNLYDETEASCSFTSDGFLPYYTPFGTHISEIALQKLIDDRLQYMGLSIEELIEATAPYPILAHWECAGVKPPEYYQRNYTHPDGTVYNSGDKKRKTGIATVRCPFFSTCYGGELSKIGFEASKVVVKTELPIDKDANGRVVLSVIF